MPTHDRDRIAEALRRAAAKGRPLTPREIEELYKREPAPAPLTGSPLERRIARRVVDPQARR